MGYTLKQARQLSGLTQAEIAEKLNICRETYAKLEKNPRSVTIDQAIMISNITGLGIGDIFFSDGLHKTWQANAD